MSIEGTITLKPKLEQSNPKWLHPWLPFIDKKVIIKAASGKTWVGVLKEVHAYELVLDQQENGEMLLLKANVESIRYAEKEC